MVSFTSAGVVLLFVLIVVLACCLLVLNRRLSELEEWREEIDGDDEPYVDKGSFPAGPERGNEDWRDQTL